MGGISRCQATSFLGQVPSAAGPQAIFRGDSGAPPGGSCNLCGKRYDVRKELGKIRMADLTPGQIAQITAALESGQELPDEYQDILFPSVRREYELTYGGKDR